LNCLASSRWSRITHHLEIEAREEIFPLNHPFRISRGSRTEACVITVSVSDGQYTGRGEGVPIARYDQSTDSVFAQIESIQIIDDLDRDKLQQLLPAGAARNAVDCALWDLEAKRFGKSAWELANISIADQSRRHSQLASIRQRECRYRAVAIDLPILN